MLLVSLPTDEEANRKPLVEYFITKIGARPLGPRIDNRISGPQPRSHQDCQILLAEHWQLLFLPLSRPTTRGSEAKLSRLAGGGSSGGYVSLPRPCIVGSGWAESVPRRGLKSGIYSCIHQVCPRGEREKKR